MFRFLSVPLCLALGMTTSSIARAEIPDLEWFEPEVVDAPVSAVSTPSGASVLSLDDTWHVVYEKDGEVYHRARTSSGWLEAEPISNDPGVSRAPHLGANPGRHELHVVWEDDRTGHPEVWTRLWTNGQWSPEACLSCDAIVSTQPDISGEGGDSSDDEVLVAWTDAWTDTSRVVARLYQDGVWGPVEAVSLGTVDGEPSVVGHPVLDSFSVVWSDRSDVEPSIYFRRRGFHPGGEGWTDPELLAMGQRPSAHAEFCCPDLAFPSFVVAFEYPFGAPRRAGSGTRSGDPFVTEVLQLESPFDEFPQPVSPQDGIPSGRPNQSGFYFPNPNGGLAIFYSAWTDSLPGGALRHVMAERASGDTALVSNVGVSDVAIGAREGNPYAEIMVVWLEDRAGSPTLLSRRAQRVGCYLPELQYPITVPGAERSALIIGPQGNPPTTLLYVDGCLGDPVPGDLAILLEFSPELDADITWDPDQPHPAIVETADSEDGGRVVFSIRGGGCSQAGTARATDFGSAERVWDGVRSPDVNGDCQVTASDLAYVQALMGTADYCADINGSGRVDQYDIDIVTATLGDQCSVIVGVDGVETPTIPRVRVHPNPATALATIAIDLPSVSPVRVRVFDVAGRQVRELDASTHSPGTAVVRWDLRDDGGRRVAPGAYFARIEIGREVRWAKLRVSG